MIALPAAPARSIRQLRMLARDVLKAAGLENAEREADWLLAHAMRLSQGQLLAAGNEPLTARQVEQARTYIDGRCTRFHLVWLAELAGHNELNEGWPSRAELLEVVNLVDPQV